MNIANSISCTTNKVSFEFDYDSYIIYLHRRTNTAKDGQSNVLRMFQRHN